MMFHIALVYCTTNKKLDLFIYIPLALEACTSTSSASYHWFLLSTLSSAQSTANTIYLIITLTTGIIITIAITIAIIASISKKRSHCYYIPNPTAAAAAFLMPATAMSSAWDGYAGQIFPADMLRHQETLEAVLQQPVMVPPLRAPPGAAAAAAEGDELLLGDAAVDGGGGGAHAEAAVPRRRPFRTDRHSKIRTAQGVRDRRMRLSVGVAREFFALQDRLGFDKASKTVNWLLTQSKPAIDRLHGAAEAEPAVAASGTTTAAAVKGRGEASSSSTCCFNDSREKARSRGDRGGPAAALMEEHGGGGGIDWLTSDAAAAVPPPPPPQAEQPMDELEYCYQYYLQLEQMMRCNNGGVPR